MIFLFIHLCEFIISHLWNHLISPYHNPRRIHPKSFSPSRCAWYHSWTPEITKTNASTKLNRRNDSSILIKLSFVALRHCRGVERVEGLVAFGIYSDGLEWKSTSLNSGLRVFFLIWVLNFAFFPMSGFRQLRNSTSTETREHTAHLSSLNTSNERDSKKKNCSVAPTDLTENTFTP